MFKLPYKYLLITAFVCVLSFIINIYMSQFSILSVVSNSIGLASALITMISFWSTNQELMALVNSLRFEQKRELLSKGDLLDEMDKKIDEIKKLI
jgi:hypothetical protein